MKILIVGMGSIGKRHASNLANLGHEVLTYDRDETKIGLTYSGEDLNDILKDAKPDAVFVCSPPAFHYEHVKAAVEAGCKVFCEKPLCSVDEVSHFDWMINLYHKPTLAIGYMLRALPELIELKNRLGGPAMGDCHRADITCHWSRPSPASYPWPGVLEETSHELDLGLWLFGPCRQVEVFTLTDHQTVFLAKHERCPTVRYNLMSDDHRYSRGIHTVTDRLTDDLRYTPEQIEPCYRTEVEAFLNGEPLCTGGEGLNVILFIQQIKEAAQ